MSYRPALTLTVHNAPSVLEAGLRAIAGGQTQFDLSELTVVDSAAVATMLAWQRAALGDGKSLVFSNLPANLQSLVNLYGVAELLQASPRADLPHH
ncbi:STAS domain-containing protein [Noviherbaspirillum sp.]|uniref:STAS domain-containing protein n=1 Tax=Noviherbaspirillum sp. TaxID=1926288 RepID=UPI002D3EAAB6|nr:STAS domain-containing protein [Noviherbaspirillum sp.]HZW22885.1 STAS domain-containing protein [Noviherbaspirillum sp.]